MKLKVMAIMKILFSAFLLLVLWCLHTFHRHYYAAENYKDPALIGTAEWFPRDPSMGRQLHSLVMEGSAYPRGREAGRLTRELLHKKEKELHDQLDKIFPTRALQLFLEAVALTLFTDVPGLIPHHQLEEMAGIAESASTDFNSLGDPFLRQIGLHGIHEIGQLMVDQGYPTMACTVLALPTNKGWIVGRNFDFEAGRIFDEEKILKWVFPDKGSAFLSVIWGGMVGAVTGVNEHGVFIAINAAGSSEFTFKAWPSTLLLLEALQFSTNAEEAVAILSKHPTLITDIFSVVDRHSVSFYRVEKSPLNTEVLSSNRASVVTNHLNSSRWNQDSVNLYRQRELTTLHREGRAKELLNAISDKAGTHEKTLQILSILRDRHGTERKSLPIGNRQAIDALIATHAVVYDSENFQIYVSRGPSLVGAFEGYDLERSFRERRPVLGRNLPADNKIDAKAYQLLKDEEKRIQILNRSSDCAYLESEIQKLEILRDSYAYHALRGRVAENCSQDLRAALRAWESALQSPPAYAREAKTAKSEIDRLRKNLP